MKYSRIFEEFGMAGGIIYPIGQTFGTFLAIFLCIRWQRQIAFVDVNNEVVNSQPQPAAWFTVSSSSHQCGFVNYNAAH